MPRSRRSFIDGLVYHVLNRGNRRNTIFHQPADYQAFLTAMVTAGQNVEMRVVAFCLMKTHFHLVLWPYKGVDVSTYMQRLMNCHIRQYLRDYCLVGTGHVYQGRYKAFPVQGDRHLFNVLRYVEANAYRAGFVARAENWEWSSLRTIRCGEVQLLAASPVARPANWLQLVNLKPSARELARLRYSVNRGAPFGDADWVAATAREFDLESTLRNRGRPCHTA